MYIDNQVAGPFHVQDGQFVCLMMYHPVKSLKVSKTNMETPKDIVGAGFIRIPVCRGKYSTQIVGLKSQHLL